MAESEAYRNRIDRRLVTICMKKGAHLYGYQSLMQQSLHNLRLDCKCLFSLLVVSAQDMDVQLRGGRSAWLKTSLRALS